MWPSTRAEVVGCCLLAAAAILLPLPSQPQITASVTPSAAQKPLRVGVYDPQGAFKNATGIAIEHVFIPWENVNLASLSQADGYARERGRELLISIEPWSWARRNRTTPQLLRDGIKSGKYDDTIRSVCSTIGGLAGPVVIRWGHEMDLGSNRYPWSGWDGDDYIAAYRYFVDECRKSAPAAKFMWSPRGERALNAYYPGDKYVDMLGISLFGLQGYDVKAFGQERSFRDLFQPTYELLQEYKKPVYIAEFGCSGDADYIAKCADFRPETLKAFPRLAGIIYFSSVDSGIWPKSYGKPDWRVTPESAHFLK